MTEDKPTKVEGADSKPKGIFQQKNQCPNNYKKKFKNENQELENATFNCGT